MSEYQYYEFQALDRPLTKREMQELRSFSTRATITSTRFVNHYEWGSFKGDPSLWMEEYFDAFLYLANWGSHEFSLRLPRRILDLATAKLYCRSHSASVRSKGDFVILYFDSPEEDDDEEGWDTGSGWLSSLIPLRADLAAGDHRVLYLAWLLCAGNRELKDDETEPPVPAGLGDLTGPLEAFADFLRIDGDLIKVAAARSPEIATSSSDQDVARWIAALPDAEKTDWLVRLAKGKESHLGSELLRRFRESRKIPPRRGGEAPRTVGDLLDAAEQLSQERRRQDAERAAAERARRKQEEAEARDRYLTLIAKREPAIWREIEMLIATKQPGKYDEAVKHLRDLRDLGLRDGREAEVEARILRLYEEHARKPSFIERLKKAGLAG